ncbi:aspartate-alanine antiporter-like transporter [Crassaminicella thermophila]
MMKFDLVAWITNPFVLMFISVFTGLLFGKIKFGKFNFGVSGTLFTGLVIGWWVLKFAKGFKETDAGYKAAQKLIASSVVSKNFFILFLVLFVAAVGLLAAKDMGMVLKKYGAKFVVLGFIITFLGAAATYGMTIISSDANPYEVSGVYTGALTSSPGLAAAIETARGHSTDWVEKYESLDTNEKERFLKLLDPSGKLTPENTPTLTDEQKAQFVKNAEAGIGVGHAIGYPFGVIIVIIAVNFFPKIFGIDAKKELEDLRKEMNKVRAEAAVTSDIEETSFDLIAFSVACFVGYTIGKIKIFLGPLGYFSLGSTGGVLIGALILGYIGKIGFMNFRMNNKILGVIRQLALAFFLAIVGLRYGFKVFDALLGTGGYLAIVSLVVGVVAMLLGFFIGRYVFKINWIMLSGAICGGMTSTPGLGAAIEAAGCDDPAAGYGATYPFALLGMVIFTILLHNMPM